VASSFFAAGAEAFFFSFTTESVEGSFIRCSYSASPEGGSEAVSCHFADLRSTSRALMACSSRAAATAR